MRYVGECRENELRTKWGVEVERRDEGTDGQNERWHGSYEGQFKKDIGWKWEASEEVGRVRKEEWQVNHWEASNWESNRCLEEVDARSN